MTRLSTAVLTAIFVVVFSTLASAQTPAPSSQQQAQAEKAFAMGNTLMEQRKPGEALVHYKQALSILPNEPSILFNAGVAAFGSKDYAYAAESWRQLKAVEPLDWHTRAKLVQVYQALGNFLNETRSAPSCLKCGSRESPRNSKNRLNIAASSSKSKVRRSWRSNFTN